VIYFKMKFIPVIFSIVTTVFSAWSFGNHCNILICCSRNISYYYQCWKCLIFFFYGNHDRFFQDSWMFNEQHLFDIKILSQQTLKAMFTLVKCLGCFRKSRNGSSSPGRHLNDKYPSVSGSILCPSL